MMMAQTNSKPAVITLRRVFGTMPCFPAAFSASHQPSSLELTTKNKNDLNVKILQQEKKVQH